MTTMLNSDDINDSTDPNEAASADRRLNVQFTVEKRLNHAANNRVADHNRSLDERIELLNAAHKFDDAKKVAEEKISDEPIYRELEFISIRVPGDNTFNVHRRVEPSDKVRFRAKYEAFKNNRGEALEGTPISDLPGIKQGQIKELEYVGVKTIEQAAGLSDSLLRMMGGQLLKKQAQDWVAKHRTVSVVEQTNAALAERDALIAQLTARLDALETKPAKAASK